MPLMKCVLVVCDHVLSLYEALETPAAVVCTGGVHRWFAIVPFRCTRHLRLQPRWCAQVVDQANGFNLSGLGGRNPYPAAAAADALRERVAAAPGDLWSGAQPAADAAVAER